MLQKTKRMNIININNKDIYQKIEKHFQKILDLKATA